MKIFKDGKMWHRKVNFADTNNVMVGYSTEQGCCEHAGWFISRDLTPVNHFYEANNIVEEVELGSYVFDDSFCENVDSEGLDQGGEVAFKLVSEGKQPLYLRLYNVHNGWYSHGFDFAKDGVILQSGAL